MANDRSTGRRPAATYIQNTVVRLRSSHESGPIRPIDLTRWRDELIQLPENGGLRRSLLDYFYAIIALPPFTHPHREEQVTAGLAEFSRLLHNFQRHYAPMIRTLTFTLRRDPGNSQVIGYYATQQNAAYNVAVDVLNREPNLPKRSGRNHLDAINKRIAAWRQGKRQTHLTISTKPESTERMSIAAC